MSEYIVCTDDLEESYYRYTDIKPETVFGHRLHEEIVRCRDCTHAHHRPNWRSDKRCKPRDLWICEAEWCMGFEGDHPETKPDWFCSHGEREEAGE